MGDGLRLPSNVVPTDTVQQRPPIAGPGPSPAPADTVRQQPPTQPADTVNRAAKGSVAATISLLGAGAAGPESVDLTTMFRGFGPGKKLELGVGVPFSGGKGQLNAIGPHELDLHMHIKVVAVYSGDVDFKIKREGDHFRMTSPQDWRADITQTDSTVKVANKDNPQQWVSFTRKGDDIVIRTGGLGQDGRKATLKVDD